MKRLLLLACFFLFVTAVPAQVESGAGALSGLIQDSSKAAVPGAKVVLSNPGIGYRKEVRTGASGEYKFSALTVVGGYQLTITAAGFATSEVKNITTSVGTVITQNATLSVGKADVTIEVQGAAVEQVQTDTTSVSQLVDSSVFQDAPLLFRSQNTFVGLVAGAAPDSAGTGRGFAVNGARTGAGNFTLEGFDDNDQGQGGAGNSAGVGGAVTTISPDAIQEYRVITSVPNAEYGRAGGFSVDTVLKSGTKQFHGSAFEYNRIQALAQNSFFSNRNGLRDHLIFNQYGGSIGGPIYKDRTFFYATAEFYRRSAGDPSSYTGTTQDFYNFVKSGAYEKWMEGTAQQNTAPDASGAIGTGFCSAQYGNAACPGQFSDVATLGAVFSKNYAQSPQSFPFGTQNLSADATDLLLGPGNFSNTGSYLPVNIYGTGNITETTKNSQNRGTMKIDQKLTEKDQLSFTYSIDNDLFADNIGGGDSSPGPAYNQVGGAQIFGAKFTHAFTPNILNEFRAGYLRHVSNFAAPGTQGIASQFTADSLSTGFGATAGFPQLFTENQFSYEDALTYTHKTHAFKGGFRFVRTRNGSSFYNDVNGSLAFWGAPGIVTDAFNEVDGLRILDGATTGPYHSALGTLYYASASQDPSTGLAPDPYRGYRANEFSAYLQDDWKATPHLTLDYGVRWDYFGPPHNFKPLIDSNVYFGSATTVTTANPFAPGGSLYLGEQSSSFRCVGFSACGNPANAAIGGYALASGTSTIWDRDLNNFAPRLGFSYDVLGTGKLVLRGGFGIGYDRLYNNVYENIRFNGPHFVDNTAGYGYGAPGISEALRTSLVQTPFVGNSALTGASPVPRHVNQHLKTAYYEQVHFGIETSLLKSYVVEANYIGTFGRQLVGLENINTFEGRVACSTAAQKAACAQAGLTTAQMSTARPSSNYGNDNFRTNGFTSNYSGGQASVRRSFNHGFQASVNYTYSKAMDEVSDVFTLKAGGTGIKTPYFPSHSYGPADFDTRHLANVSVNYVSQSATHKLLLAGWGISPIVQMHSGTPIYATSSSSTYDPNKDGSTGNEKVVYAGPGTIKNAISHNHSPAGDGVGGAGAIAKGSFKQYVCPANVNSGLFCDVPGDRQELYGLRFYNMDLAVSKHIDLGERFKLTLQAAFFDVDGHTEFGNPSADINSSNFGYSLSAQNRQGQLSGRIDF